MNESSQCISTLAELEPDLVATPYRVQTNRHVITGAVCCGKTTLIDLLADRGFQTVAEVPRQYIEWEVAKGRTGRLRATLNH